MAGPTAAELCLANPYCALTVGAATGVSLACVINPDLCGTIVGLACEDIRGAFGPLFNEEDSDTGGGSPQDKKLTKGEIKKLKDRNIDPHDLKDNSRQDLFKDKNGNIIVKPKDGSGPGESTGLNINNL